MLNFFYNHDMCTVIYIVKYTYAKLPHVASVIGNEMGKICSLKEFFISPAI